MVFQRQLEWHQIETIERVKNLSTAFRIFELDDLITNRSRRAGRSSDLAWCIAMRRFGSRHRPKSRASCRTEYHEWVPLYDYAKKLASLDLDLAVAPLEHHPFNEAKSNLRLLEYGVLGYPVLWTDILPYQCGLPVFRVANRHHAWTKAIREMVADPEACQRAGESLCEAVLTNWMLEDHLDEWQRAWLP
jgi:hypothetical protein